MKSVTIAEPEAVRLCRQGPVIDACSISAYVLLIDLQDVIGGFLDIGKQLTSS